MRISDWSSDVCSSDLILARAIYDRAYRNCCNGEAPEPGDESWRSYESEATAALTALHAAGFVIVPFTPDVAMIDAGDEVMMNRYGCSFEPGPIYRAMIQAGET